MAILTDEEQAAQDRQAALRQASVKEMGTLMSEMQALVDELEDGIKDRVAKAELIMDEIKLEVRKRLNDDGLKNFALPNGASFYTRKSDKVSCADWDAFYKFLETEALEHGVEYAFAAFQKRPSAEFVNTYADEHERLPPGINRLTERLVVYRRPNSKEDD